MVNKTLITKQPFFSLWCPLARTYLRLPGTNILSFKLFALRLHSQRTEWLVKTFLICIRATPTFKERFYLASDFSRSHQMYPAISVIFHRAITPRILGLQEWSTIHLKAHPKIYPRWEFHDPQSSRSSVRHNSLARIPLKIFTRIFAVLIQWRTVRVNIRWLCSCPAPSKLDQFRWGDIQQSSSTRSDKRWRNVHEDGNNGGAYLHPRVEEERILRGPWNF